MMKRTLTISGEDQPAGDFAFGQAIVLEHPAEHGPLVAENVFVADFEAIRIRVVPCFHRLEVFLPKLDFRDQPIFFGAR
jgi:hypothetical protein